MKTIPIPCTQVVPQDQQVERPIFNSPEYIVYQVCRYFEIKEADILKKGRKGQYVTPRQIIAYRLNRETAMSLWKIGKRLNRDHRTIMYSVDRIEGDIKFQTEVWQDMENMKNGVEVKPKKVKVKKCSTAISTELKAQIYHMSERGYSQRVIAYKTGLHPDTVRRYQRLQTA